MAIRRRDFCMTVLRGASSVCGCGRKRGCADRSDGLRAVHPVICQFRVDGPVDSQSTAPR
jgi:hypothetical protein